MLDSSRDYGVLRCNRFASCDCGGVRACEEVENLNKRPLVNRDLEKTNVQSEWMLRTGPDRLIYCGR